MEKLRKDRMRNKLYKEDDYPPCFYIEESVAEEDKLM